MVFYKYIKIFCLIIFCCQASLAQNHTSLEIEGIKLYNEGLRLANEKIFDESINSLNLSIEKFPSLMKAYFLKSRILGQLKRHEEAISTCNDALNIKKEQPLILSQKACSLYALQRYKESLKIAELAVKYGNNLSYTYVARANSNATLGNYKLAIEDYDRALELVKDRNHNSLDETYLNRFCPLYSLKRYEEALATCDKALEITDNAEKLPQIYSKKAAALNKLGKYEEALEYSDKALTVNSKDLQAIKEKKLARSKL